MTRGAGNIVGMPKLAAISDLLPAAAKPAAKRLYNHQQVGTGVPRVHQTCQACGNRVFILERLIVDSKLYHRTCFSCHKCQALLQPGAYVEGDAAGTYECAVCPADEKQRIVAPHHDSPSLSHTSSSSASLSSIDDDTKSFESAAGPSDTSSLDARSNGSPRLPRLSQDAVELPKSAQAGLELAQSVIGSSEPGDEEQENGASGEGKNEERRRRSDEVELSRLITKPPLPSKPPFLVTKNRFGLMEKKGEFKNGEFTEPVASPDSETTPTETPDLKEPEKIYSQPFRPPRLKSTLKRMDTVSSSPTHPEDSEGSVVKEATQLRTPSKYPLADIPLIFSPTYQLKPLRPALNRVQSENSLSSKDDKVLHLVGGDSREMDQVLQVRWSRPTPLQHTSLTDMRKDKLSQDPQVTESEPPKSQEAKAPPSDSKADSSSPTPTDTTLEEKTKSGGDKPSPKIEDLAEEAHSKLDNSSDAQMKPSESYPEDLNPFMEEEEEETPHTPSKQDSYPDDLNPFGDEDDEDVTPPVLQTPPRPVVVKVSCNDYDSSLNPFGEDDTNEVKSTPPQPTPPKTPVSRGLSMNSPTGSLRSNRSVPGTLKKRRAPLPPTVKPQEEGSPIKSPNELAPEWKKKKRPAPPVPIPPRRSIKKIPVEEIHKEMEEINGRLKELEKQGRDLETRIRDKPRAEEPSPEDEDRINTFFELMNEKNSLFRRQAELMYLKRYQRLEEEQVELDYQLRCIINKPRPQKTEEDLQKEEQLLQRFLEVVEQRNEVVESIDLDRKRFQEDQKLMPPREVHEELIISERLDRGSAAAAAVSKKDKKKKKKKKKDKTKESGDGGTKLKKKWLRVL